MFIAYQIHGEGPQDVVFLGGFATNLEIAWEHPSITRLYRRLAPSFRMLSFDKRGTGLSDRLGEVATLEECMDDARSVMDEVGSKRAALLGQNEGGPMAMLFAATYPDRVSALILYGSYPKLIKDESYPIGWEPDTWEQAIELAQEGWGSGTVYSSGYPHLVYDEQFMNWAGRFERHSTSPGGVNALMRMMADIDVRYLLPTIRVPTLILHHVGDPVFDVNHARFMASQIPDSKLVELPGNYNADWYEDSPTAIEEVEEFLTGTRQAPESNRVLATVLFTDLVASTKMAVEMGDRRWRDLLDAHDAMVRAQIGLFRGSEVKHLGDGFLATFDGPARAIRCALAIRAGGRQLGLDAKAGLHTGEVEVRGEDLGGIAVHIASRVADVAKPGEILVSRTVVDTVAGAGIEFEERGDHELRGIPDSWSLFAVVR